MKRRIDVNKIFKKSKGTGDRSFANSGGAKMKLNFCGKKKLLINPNKIKINKSAVEDADSSMYNTREESKAESELDINLRKLRNEITALKKEKENLKIKLQSYVDKMHPIDDNVIDDKSKEY